MLGPNSHWRRRRFGSKPHDQTPAGSVRTRAVALICGPGSSPTRYRRLASSAPPRQVAPLIGPVVENRRRMADEASFTPRTGLIGTVLSGRYRLEAKLRGGGEATLSPARAHD